MVAEGKRNQIMDIAHSRGGKKKGVLWEEEGRSKGANLKKKKRLVVLRGRHLPNAT